jgi:hypothetical protein
LAQIDVDEAMRRRSVQEAIQAALAETWLRRAAAFDAVWPGLKPLPLEAPMDVVSRAPAAVQVALACRRRAWLLLEELADDDD